MTPTQQRGVAFWLQPLVFRSKLTALSAIL